MPARRWQYPLGSILRSQISHASISWWQHHYGSRCCFYSGYWIRRLLSLRWMQPKLVPSWMGLLQCQLANILKGQPVAWLFHQQYPSQDGWILYDRYCFMIKRLWVGSATWWFHCIRFSIRLASHTSQCISLQPWHMTKMRSLPCPVHKMGTLEALHAINAWSTWAFLCTLCAIAWLNPSATTCKRTMEQSDVFVSNACMTSCTSAACDGGILFFMVIWYWIIPTLHFVSHHTCGGPFASKTAAVATATLLGSFADGDAGDYANRSEYDLDTDFVPDESIEPLWPIHKGNLLLMG